MEHIKWPAGSMFHMAQKSRKVGPFTKAVATELREAAERLELTQLAISQRAGIPRSTVTKIMSGEVAVDVEAIAMLAGAVGMTLTGLMEAAERRIGMP